MSIASDTKVFRVICFDRAAKVLFGCSADEFFDFAKLHPFAGTYLFSILSQAMCFVREFSVISLAFTHGLFMIMLLLSMVFSHCLSFGI